MKISYEKDQFYVERITKTKKIGNQVVRRSFHTSTSGLPEKPKTEDEEDDRT